MAQILLSEKEFDEYNKLKKMVDENCLFVIAARGSSFCQIHVWTESEAVKELASANKTLMESVEYYHNKGKK